MAECVSVADTELYLQRITNSRMQHDYHETGNFKITMKERQHNSNGNESIAYLYTA